MSLLNADAYVEKPAAYFEEYRPEMLGFVPSNAATILDVGCSDGRFGASIKRRQQCEVWGVEIVPASAEKAGARLDRVFCSAFEDASLPERYFDCVVFNDCLEHFADPEKVLALTIGLLTPGGSVVASIPNMRYFPVMRDLILHGAWEYSDWGVLDRTHLRFFTGKSIGGIFERTGYTVKRLEGINPYLWGCPRSFKLLNTLLGGAISDMRYQQFAVVATRA